MAYVIDTQAYLDTVVELLRSGHDHVPVTVAGTSMCPFLYPDDVVFLDPLTKPAAPGDIVLFTRPDGKYVLHRIIACRSDGSYRLLGDNQIRPERVSDASHLHAIVSCAKIRSRIVTPKHIRWWFFRSVWRKFIRLRIWCGRLSGHKLP